MGKRGIGKEGRVCDERVVARASGSSGLLVKRITISSEVIYGARRGVHDDARDGPSGSRIRFSFSETFVFSQRQGGCVESCNRIVYSGILVHSVVATSFDVPRF